jgi:hypothetical protein
MLYSGHSHAGGMPMELTDSLKTLLIETQQFPLSLQAQGSPGSLHWPFVNCNAQIPPGLEGFGGARAGVS